LGGGVVERRYGGVLRASALRHHLRPRRSELGSGAAAGVVVACVGAEFGVDMSGVREEGLAFVVIYYIAPLLFALIFERTR
jgi:hypothetical protein